MLCERSQGQKKTYLGFHSSETLEIIETTNLCYSDKKLISGCLGLAGESRVTVNGYGISDWGDKNSKTDCNNGCIIL